MGKNISNKEIQLTIQGQTVVQILEPSILHNSILSNCCMPVSRNELFSTGKNIEIKMKKPCCRNWQMKVLKPIINLKNHPDFLDYLAHVSPLKFYS